MDLATMQMDRKEARKAFLEYRRSVRERHSKEDEQIMAGYRQMSLGRPLIELHSVLRAGGVDALGRPKLAICRADAQWCWYDRWDCEFRMTRNSTGRPRKDSRVRLGHGFFPEVAGQGSGTCKAMLPLIPPSLRPAAKLENFHVLWEADWQQAPVDPALLKHVGGTLYAVLATWDLTPLERAVLNGRLATAPN